MVPRGLHGTVFPARRGAVAQVQLLTKEGWRTVRRIRLGTGGAYSVPLSRRATYRLVYRAAPGPAVTVG